ncbi:MAG: sugar phosphate isomerase/epimerase family protein [Armatimonadota bacterium]
MKLALLTYNMAAEWDLDTLLEKCVLLGFEGVEFRTDRDHAHGVEVEMTEAQRNAVREKCETAGVEIAGLSSGCAYDSMDRDELEANIERTRKHLDLCADLGTGGVKVYGNRLHVDEGVPAEETIEQIGGALAGLSEYAEGLGVQVRFEMHGDFTTPEVCNRLMELAGDGEGICLIYNCNNAYDVDDDGSVEGSYRAVAERVEHVHIHDLADPEFPYLELLGLLHEDGYEGWCSAELQDSPDRERLLRFYVELWHAYLRIVGAE